MRRGTVVRSDAPLCAREDEHDEEKIRANPLRNRTATAQARVMLRRCGSS